MGDQEDHRPDGDKVRLESATGRGSTFILELAIYQSPSITMREVVQVSQELNETNEIVRKSELSGFLAIWSMLWNI
jgi:hypothetical protein